MSAFFKSKIFQSSWFLSLILLGIFLLITEYKYGWDDQHLEIPLLKHLIDDQLYAGDYYVESLKENFSSFFYHILARFITVEQIPAAYFLLYVLSRYFLLFWIYKLWQWISGRRFDAFVCVLTFILMARVHEFVYRTFSHQEFALAIIFAGIYYFFKERFVLSAMILGIAANLHALYSLFPMMFMGLYLLISVRKHGWALLVKAGATFAAFSAPFLVWVFRSRLAGGGEELWQSWIDLYRVACPQNFILPPVPFEHIIKDPRIFLGLIDSYILLVALFLLLICFMPLYRQNGKAIVFTIGAFLLLIVSFLFTFVHPNRFVVDLNLIRNSQYLYFLLMGYTTLLVIRICDRQIPLLALSAVLLFSLLKYSEMIAVGATVSLILLLALVRQLETQEGWKRTAGSIFLGGCLGGALYWTYWSFHAVLFRPFIYANFILLGALCVGTYLLLVSNFAKRHQPMIFRGFILIPLTVFLFQFGYYRIEKTINEKRADGFWRMQRSWEDMQRFVQKNTPVDAMVLVPYDMEMGGFRIQSERKIVASYRDCGIVGFDYPAALEWQRRIKDIASFSFAIRSNPIDAIQKAVIQYGADYIVFMRYATPREGNAMFERVYTNSDFALFKVRPNPAIDILRQKINEQQ